MSDQFLGQLLLTGFNFAPVGWVEAAGQIVSISQYSALFALLGVNYGGNGTSNFGLPNLGGNCAMGFGSSPGIGDYVIGETGGSSTVTLSGQELPSHTHAVLEGVSRGAEVSEPAGNCFSTSDSNVYNADTKLTLTAMNAGALTPFVGASQPHNNMMPYLALNWIISLTGVFPERP
jgi:microcystin-dependent protein